jgi:hypothetical protein
VLEQGVCCGQVGVELENFERGVEEHLSDA